jgi:hypothetical protein
MALLLGVWIIPARAQEHPPEQEAIFKRGFQLYEAGKFAEAVPVAVAQGIAGARFAVKA